MLSRTRKRVGTPATAIAVIALVFAMVGGAYAASSALTKKQKKEVEKIAKKYAGKPGPPGAQGPAGANGKNGTNGTNGTNGSDGRSVVTTALLPGEGCIEGGTEFEVEGSSSSEAICNGLEGEPGEPGEEGQAAGFNYLFSTSTTATDPGSGKLAFNKAASNEATVLSVSNTDVEGNGLASVIANWGVTGSAGQGTLLIRKAEEPSTFAEYTITVNKKEGETFRNISLVFVAGKGTFANEDEVTIAYWGSSSETLPKGATESGVWSFKTRGVQEFEDKNSNTVTVGTPEAWVPISFAIPFSGNITEAAGVHISTEDSSAFALHCNLGANSKPEVITEKTLCIFVSTLENATFFHIEAGGKFAGFSRTGGSLVFGINPSALGFGFGQWAVKN